MLTRTLAIAALAATSARPALAQYTQYQQASITISSGPPAGALVYPSTIFLDPTLAPYLIASKVTVTLHGFTHTWPDDVDIMLRHPSYGRTIMLMSDCGSSFDAANLTITFDPDATTDVPDEAQLTSGTFRPTDREPGDSLPAPAPAAPYGSLSSLRGIIPLNDWELYIADDTEQDGGLVSSWSMTIYPESEQRQIHSFPTSVNIPSSGNAATYPMLMHVRGFEGTPQFMSVTLYLVHGSPADLDILLVAPNGASCVLMSDAGGTTPTTGSQLSFRVPVSGTPIPAPLPAFGPTLLPTDLAPGEVWPTPAPPGPHGTNLAPLGTVNPNGTWKLFVVDDTAGNTGFLGQWSMQFDGAIYCASDFNRSGGTSVQDLFDYLVAYFAGCP